MAVVVLPARSVAVMTMVLTPGTRLTVALKVVPLTEAFCGLPLLSVTVTVEDSLMVPVRAMNDCTEVLLSAGAETVSTGTVVS